MIPDKTSQVDLPFLRGASPVFQDDFRKSVQRVQLEKGQFICMEQDKCQGLPVVIEGVARVYKMSDSGRELTLYRIDPGDSCILTASCLASDIKFPAFAIAETDIDAWFVPASIFGRWLDLYPEWRQYVFTLFARRIDSVIELVEEIAFHKMDSRLAMYLIDQSTKNAGTVQRTHEQIATDLGTSREVVSRLLKEFENRGLVTLSRGSVSVIDAGRLNTEIAAERSG